MIVALDGQPEIRFTPSGKQVAILYVHGHRGVRFEAWEEVAESLLDADPLPDDGEVLRLTGYNKARTYETREGPKTVTVYTIKSWERVA